MGFFSDPKEIERRENLKKLEDKRLKLAGALDQQGFKPEKMLFAQAENGGFVAVGVHGGARWVIASPALGSDDDFIVEHSACFPVRKQDVFVQSEGMGGIMGFGKKGEHGVEYVVTLSDSRELKMPFVYGRSNWAEFPLKKNPLLSTRRRRGDANIVWDLRPVDNMQLPQIIALADACWGL